MRFINTQRTVAAVAALALAVPAVGFASPGKSTTLHGKQSVKTTRAANTKASAKTRTVVYIHLPGATIPTDLATDPNVCQDTGQFCTDAQLCAFRSENCDALAAPNGDLAIRP